MPSELCKNCGKVHEQPFSDEVIKLYHKIRSVSDSEERDHLIHEMVGEFVCTFDSTNEDMSDVIHDLVDDFHSTGMKHHHATMHLGRTLLRNLHTYMKSETARMRKETPETN